jgi:hypothetical protein
MHIQYKDKLVNTVYGNNPQIIYVYTENHSKLCRKNAESFNVTAGRKVPAGIRAKHIPNARPERRRETTQEEEIVCEILTSVPYKFTNMATMLILTGYA